MNQNLCILLSKCIQVPCTTEGAASEQLSIPLNKLPWSQGFQMLTPITLPLMKNIKNKDTKLPQQFSDLILYAHTWNSMPT